MIDPKKHSEGKVFTVKDVGPYGINCLLSDLIYNPPAWMRAGRQETASGYGQRLNSGYMIRFERRIYRLYVSIFSNNGTTWFKTGNRTITVSAH